MLVLSVAKQVINFDIASNIYSFAFIDLQWLNFSFTLIKLSFLLCSRLDVCNLNIVKTLFPMVSFVFVLSGYLLPSHPKAPWVGHLHSACLSHVWQLSQTLTPESGNKIDFVFGKIWKKKKKSCWRAFIWMDVSHRLLKPHYTVNTTTLMDWSIAFIWMITFQDFIRRLKM